jgi:hypothetical protein
MTTTYSTKEQATRMGKMEAEKLTQRGYPTVFVRAEQVIVEGALHMDGTVPSDTHYYASNDVRFVAVYE